MNESVGVFDISGVLAIDEDREKNMWFGTDKKGLVRSKDGKADVFTMKDGLPSDEMTAFLELKDGRICIGTRAGLVFFENGKFTVLTAKDGLTGNYVRSLYEDAEGVLWIGTYDYGLSRYKDGKFTNYRPENGLYSKNVFCILEDENGWFWMNSNTGIYRVSRRQLEEFADGKI